MINTNNIDKNDIWEEVGELDPFTGICPYCGAEMEIIDYNISASCEVIARWICQDCEEEERLLGSVWVYNAGENEGFVVPDSDIGR